VGRGFEEDIGGEGGRNGGNREGGRGGERRSLDLGEGGGTGE